jgi:hypothetical protein
MARAVVAAGALARLSVAGLVLPTAASASITTVYTKDYAGYYAKTTLNPRGNLTVTTALPPLSSLAKYTVDVMSEIRLHSSTGGVITLKIYGNTYYASSWPYYNPSFDVSGFGSQATLNADLCDENVFADTYLASGSYPQDVYVNNPGYNDGNTTVDWTLGNTSCEVDFSSVIKFTKVAMVGTIYRSGFTRPSSAVTLTGFSGVSIPNGSQNGTFTSYPHGRYVATSTGTSSGTVYAKPSLLSSGGSAFSVILP